MSKRQLAFGLILIFVGMVFLLQTLDILWISFGDLVQFMFPVGLIGLGAWLIMRKRKQEMQTPPPDESARPTYQSSYDYGSEQQAQPADPTGPVTPPHPHPPSPPPPPPPDGPGQSDLSSQSQFQQSSSSRSSYTGAKTKYSNFLGDLNITCDNVDMRNVEVSGFLGDIEVLLRQARLGPGLSRMVLSGFIGDIRIMVPTGMAVFASGSNFIGDMDLFGRRTSGFGNSIDGQTENYNSAEKKLYIAINTFIGDIRVIEV